MITASLEFTDSNLKGKQNGVKYFCQRNKFIFCMVLSHFVLSVYSDPTGSNLLKNVTHHTESTGESSLPLVAKIVGSSLLALLCFSGIFWFAFRYRKKSRSV